MKNHIDEVVILNDIPFGVEAHECFPLLRLKAESRRAYEFSAFFDQARAAARPKAAFKVMAVQEAGDEYVRIGGVRFDGRILAVNLKDSPVVFPFVATCGSEVDAWAGGIEGTLHRFWADTIMMLCLAEAVSTLEEHLRQRLAPAKLSTMNPGSLEDWPLQQQACLFKLLGDAPGSIGLSLGENFLLRPLKSVSGIQFISDEKFINCRLCPRQDCEGRMAPYDPALYEMKYGTP